MAGLLSGVASHSDCPAHFAASLEALQIVHTRRPGDIVPRVRLILRLQRDSLRREHQRIVKKFRGFQSAI